MAYSAADIDATGTWSDVTGTEVTDAAADYPLIIASHVIRDARANTNFGVKWIDGTGGSAAYSGTDDTDDGGTPSYPTTAVYDNHSHTDSRPLIDASETEWWLIAYAGDSSAFGDFDAVVIGGHNLQSIGATDVELYVSDSTDVEASGVKIYDWGDISSDPTKRLVALDLDDGANAKAQRFTGVIYLALKMTVPSAAVPRVGEFWVGLRKQLSNAPRMGYNKDQSTSQTADHVSLSGVRTRMTYHEGRYQLNPKYITRTAAQASIITSGWTLCKKGAAPIYWIELPNSAPTVARLMYLSNPALPGGNTISSLIRQWELSMVECAPMYDGE